MFGFRNNADVTENVLLPITSRVVCVANMCCKPSRVAVFGIRNTRAFMKHFSEKAAILISGDAFTRKHSMSYRRRPVSDQAAALGER